MIKMDIISSASHEIYLLSFKFRKIELGQEVLKSVLSGTYGLVCVPYLNLLATLVKINIRGNKHRTNWS